MCMRKIKILGAGVYVPKRSVPSSELALKINVKEEIVQKMGMKNRYYANSMETSSYMGSRAAENALADAGLTLNDIDLLVCASGTMQMPIPCTAALIHKELRPLKHIPAFDINSTCLSFITAIDSLSYLIDANRYKNVLVVSSEVASVGLNYNNLESATLFGDGAAAFVISKTPSLETSKILSSQMETYSSLSHHCMIEGGGSGYSAANWTEENKDKFLFHMNGKEVFRLALKVLPDFMEKLLLEANTKIEEVDVVIPHQASLSAMKLLQKKLNIQSCQMINIVENYGNMIAASIPMALHIAIKSGKLTRGKKVLLLGTSAGISVGGLVFEY